MGRLDTVVDQTGTMSPLDVNAENIVNIIDELNRNSDQLDNLQKGLAVTNPGNVSLNLAAGPSGAQVSVPLGSVSPFSFLAFMQRSDQSGNFWTLPYLQVSSPGSSAANQIVAYATLNPISNSTQVQLTFNVVVASGVTPPTSVTFYYYILNQPANPGV